MRILDPSLSVTASIPELGFGKAVGSNLLHDLPLSADQEVTITLLLLLHRIWIFPSGCSRIVGWITEICFPSFRSSVRFQVRPRSEVVSMCACHPLYSVLDGHNNSPLASIAGLFLIGPQIPFGNLAGFDQLLPLSTEVISSPHQSEQLGPTSSEIGKRNPFEERLFFPSQDFAKLWQTVPYRTFPIGPTKGENGMSVSAIVRYPPVDVLSKGIVVFNSGNNDDEALSSDYLDYIAMRGYIAVTCPFSNSENKMLADSKSLLRATLTVFSESHLPMYLAGVKSGGRHMMLAGSDCDSARVRGILAVDAELDWPFPELSPMKKLPNSKIASFLLVSSMESPEMKMQMKAFMEIADCHNKTVTCSVVEKNVTTPELDGIDLCLDLLEKQKIKE